MHTFSMSGDLPYDYEDFGLTATELQVKYSTPGEHPEYTIKFWHAGPYSNGYWNWVAYMIAADDEATPSNGTYEDEDD